MGISMRLDIDPRSAIPIYSQIFAEIEGLIGRGGLRAGDRVPSVRDLAVRLRVNRNTVARAYRMLEEAGLIETRVGQGSFVGHSAPRWSESEARALLGDSVDRLLAEADRLGVPRRDLLTLLEGRIDASSGRPPGPTTIRRSKP
jgi:GntR family transcriptional regulator